MVEEKKSEKIMKNLKKGESTIPASRRQNFFEREKQELTQLKKMANVSKKIAGESFRIERTAEKMYARLKKYYKNRGKVLIKLNHKELKILLRNLNDSNLEECRSLASIIEIEAK